MGPGKRGLNGVVPGYPTSTNLPQVDKLSIDPRDLGRHSASILRHEVLNGILDTSSIL